MCPEKDLNDLLRVKNSYYNEDNRVSFHIEINKCNRWNGIKANSHYSKESIYKHDCKLDPVIEKMLNVVFFTFQTMNVDVEFGGDIDDSKEIPLRISDGFHSQF